MKNALTTVGLTFVAVLSAAVPALAQQRGESGHGNAGHAPAAAPAARGFASAGGGGFHGGGGHGGYGGYGGGYSYGYARGLGYGGGYYRHPRYYGAVVYPYYLNGVYVNDVYPADYEAPTVDPAPIAPPQTYVDNDSGNYCRQFSQEIAINGQPSESYGTACLQPDGTWRVVQ